jgi:hypothetical protein
MVLGLEYSILLMLQFAICLPLSWISPAYIRTTVEKEDFVKVTAMCGTVLTGSRRLQRTKARFLPPLSPRKASKFPAIRHYIRWRTPVYVVV